jgi:uncharacterized lipoprotein YajG
VRASHFDLPWIDISNLGAMGEFMKLASSLAAVALLAACATEPFPSKRPLTSDAMETMGQTKVVITESNNAIQASWFAQDS